LLMYCLAGMDGWLW